KKIQEKPLLLGAPSRIKNHLAYRLGQIAVTNSKTIGGYFRLPFNLIKEYKQYNQEQKNYQMIIKLNPTLALPKLQDYNDYQEAVKIKKYFSYRLGEAIIQANNTWYGGGYIKLWFKIKRLRKEIGKG
ncbi:sugar transferase, partial [Campylobacter jejuni]|nr:sugar transferase [Campylobacter jejuni]